MDIKESQALGADAETHWYYVSKGRAITQLIGDLRCESVLDVGSGSCVFSRLLLENGVCRRAIGVDTEYSTEETANCAGGVLLKRRAISSSRASLVLMIDVLEHVEDDAALLTHYVDLSPAETQFIISVPAFELLWSSHDDFLEHHRRYTLAQLETLIAECGLKLESGQYFFGLLLPIVAIIRFAENGLSRLRRKPAASSLRPVPKWLNRILVAIHDMERRFLFPWNRLGGLSVFCVARKPQD